MKTSYIRNSEENYAKFWLKRLCWEPTDVAKKIAGENSPEKTGYIADIGGAHGREALWLAEHGFHTILLEPNKYSLRFAKERARNKKLGVNMINVVLPYLPIRSETIDVVDFYYTLHQIRNEYKLKSLKEIYRILKPHGILYSASFGNWKGHEMPSSIHPITRKEIFIKLHISAGFKPIIEVKKRSDSIKPFEKFWYGEFQKI